jgi:hypothetical protein
MKAAFNVALVIIMVATLVMSTSANSRIPTQVQAQTLPTCVDPTGKNLPCMIVISTLPAPANTVQCQEPTGKILPCSYATQILSNGQQVVVITVYVPPNFIFASGPISVVKEIIVHETKTRVVHECPDDQILNHTTVKCVNKPTKLPCERPDSDAVTDLDKDLKTKNCDTADANEINKTPLPSPSSPNCNSQTSNGTCPAPTGTNSTSSSNSKSLAKVGSSSEKNNVTAPIDCKANPSDPSCPLQQTPLLTTKKCPDGSVIYVNTNCPTNMSPSSMTPPPAPPNPNHNPSSNNPGSENNPQSPPSNNPSSNSENSGSSSTPSSSDSGSSGSNHLHHS